MPKKSERKFGNYYRKRVPLPDGGYRDVYGKTLAERDEKVEALQRQLAAEKAEREEKGEAVYFFEYAAAWYGRQAPHMSDQMKAVHARNINSVICPVIGQKKMNEITTDDLADVMVGAAGKSKSYQKKLVMTIKQIFAAAVDANLIPKSPAAKLQPQGSDPAEKRALTEGQQDTLLQAVAGLPVETFCKIGLYTGMRREEILGLRWDCVELEGKAPHVTVRRACHWPDNFKPVVTEELKTPNAFRTIPIPPQLVEHLKGELQKLGKEKVESGSVYVIHDEEGGALTYSAFRSMWRAVDVRCVSDDYKLGDKIRNHKIIVTMDFKVTPHILRHTYITRLILAGVPLKRVQYLAGHSDPQITIKIYTDLMGHAPEDLIGDILSAFASETAADNKKGSTPESTPKA